MTGEHEHVYAPVIRRVPPDRVPAFEMIVGYRCKVCGARKPMVATGPRENIRAALRYMRERYGNRDTRRT